MIWRCSGPNRPPPLSIRSPAKVPVRIRPPILSRTSSTRGFVPGRRTRGRPPRRRSRRPRRRRPARRSRRTRDARSRPPLVLRGLDREQVRRPRARPRIPSGHGPHGGVRPGHRGPLRHGGRRRTAPRAVDGGPDAVRHEGFRPVRARCRYSRGPAGGLGRHGHRDGGHVRQGPAARRPGPRQRADRRPPAARSAPAVERGAHPPRRDEFLQRRGGDGRAPSRSRPTPTTSPPSTARATRRRSRRSTWTFPEVPDRTRDGVHARPRRSSPFPNGSPRSTTRVPDGASPAVDHPD